MTEARAILGVSWKKMVALVREKTIAHYNDPLDKKAKLVSRAEVEALKVRDKAA